LRIDATYGSGYRPPAISTNSVFRARPPAIRVWISATIAFTSEAMCIKERGTG
jgi:hypothetical protein